MQYVAVVKQYSILGLRQALAANTSKPTMAPDLRHSIQWGPILRDRMVKYMDSITD